MQRLARILPLIVLALASLVAVRFAVAETLAERDTVESLKRAIAIESPAASEVFYERLADLDHNGELSYWREAKRLNPRSSAASIAIGLREESEGHRDRAESEFLDAAKIDRRYLPAWTLANFYFRQSRDSKFWSWAQKAASLVYDDSRPLLQLAQKKEEDPGAILEKLGDSARLRGALLDMLIGENRLDLAQGVGKRMLSDSSARDRVIDLADRQIRAGHSRDALELWNVVSGFPPLDPSRGPFLTDGAFATRPANQGFGWRIVPSEGIAADWSSSQLRFTLAGSEPETCALLEQPLALAENNYKLSYNYTTSGLSASTGLRWQLADSTSPSLESSPASRTDEFRAHLRKNGITQLRLFYRRDPGEVRAEGSVTLRNIRLEALR
jgi:hypothetical protein